MNYNLEKLGILLLKINGNSKNNYYYGNKPYLHEINFNNGDGKQTLFRHIANLFNYLLVSSRNPKSSYLSKQELAYIFTNLNFFQIDIIYTRCLKHGNQISFREFFDFLTIDISPHSLKQILKCRIIKTTEPPIIVLEDFSPKKETVTRPTLLYTNPTKINNAKQPNFNLGKTQNNSPNTLDNLKKDKTQNNKLHSYFIFQKIIFIWKNIFSCFYKKN